MRFQVVKDKAKHGTVDSSILLLSISSKHLCTGARRRVMGRFNNEMNTIKHHFAKEGLTLVYIEQRLSTLVGETTEAGRKTGI